MKPDFDFHLVKSKVHESKIEKDLGVNEVPVSH